MVIEFSDGMKVEILPAMRQTDRFGNITYTYPDTHMGGNWLNVSDFYLKAPGSGMSVNTKNSFECLDKALRKMVE